MPCATPREVFDHQVKALNEANRNEVAYDYAEEAFLITKDDGVVKGREAINKWFEAVLSGPLVGAQFEATSLIIEGHILYLEWNGEGTKNVASGVDTFVIHGDRIHAQTVKLSALHPDNNLSGRWTRAFAARGLVFGDLVGRRLILTHNGCSVQTMPVEWMPL